MDAFLLLVQTSMIAVITKSREFVVTLKISTGKIAGPESCLKKEAELNCRMSRYDNREKY